MPKKEIRLSGDVRRLVDGRCARCVRFHLCEGCARLFNVLKLFRPINDEIVIYDPQSDDQLDDQLDDHSTDRLDDQLYKRGCEQYRQNKSNGRITSTGSFHSRYFVTLEHLHPHRLFTYGAQSNDIPLLTWLYTHGFEPLQYTYGYGVDNVLVAACDRGNIDVLELFHRHEYGKRDDYFICIGRFLSTYHVFSLYSWINSKYPDRRYFKLSHIAKGVCRYDDVAKLHALMMSCGIYNYEVSHLIHMCFKFASVNIFNYIVGADETYCTKSYPHIARLKKYAATVEVNITLSSPVVFTPECFRIMTRFQTIFKTKFKTPTIRLPSSNFGNVKSINETIEEIKKLVHVYRSNHNENIKFTFPQWGKISVKRLYIRTELTIAGVYSCDNTCYNRHIYVRGTYFTPYIRIRDYEWTTLYVARNVRTLAGIKQLIDWILTHRNISDLIEVMPWDADNTPTWARVLPDIASQ